MTSQKGQEADMNYEVNPNKVHPEISTMPEEKRRPYAKRQGFLSGQPADLHKDALVCANGKMYLLAYGQPALETAVFAEETLFLRRWKEAPKPPRIAGILPEVRKKLRAGDYRSVPDYVINEIVGDPVYDELMPLSPDKKSRYSIKRLMRHIAYVMKLDGIKTGTEARNYLRSMDLEKGEALVRFEDEDGIHTRRSFVSAADPACVQEFCFPKTRKEIRLSLTHEKLAGVHEWDGLLFYENLKTSLEFDGEILTFTGFYPEESKNPGMGFFGAVRVVTDGSACLKDGILSVEHADRLFLLSVIRSFKEWDQVLYDETREALLSLPDDYDMLLQRHDRIHGEMMRRAGVVFADDEDLTKTVEEILTEQKCGRGVSRLLLEKMYHMSRYFLISHTGTLPPCKGQYNINTNLQVCSGNIGALPEKMRVFFDFFESKFEDFRVNAKNIFGFRGIMGSIHPDMDSGYQYHFSGPWPHEYWISCAGWVFHEFWDYFLTTGDEEFLRDHVVPGLKEIALFYEDYLTDTDEFGHWIFYPCFSPENGQSKGYPITINAVMDISVCCEVLENLIRACEILKITAQEAENLKKWKDMLAKMPPLLLDEEGGLKEWAKADIPENYEHRHVSHHYPVWPAHQVTWEKAPELAEAVLISNRTRGQENDSAHGIMHRMFTAIRLQDEEGAQGYFKQIFERGFVNNSLITNHFPHKAYYADALGGMAAAITECVVFSEEGRIVFLPAAFGAMKKGTLRGARLFTRAALDSLHWDSEEGYLKAEITSLCDQELKIGLRGGIKEAWVNGRPAPLAEGNVLLSAKRGETAEIKMLF